LGADRSGLDSGSGSTSYTSSAAPAIDPDRSAASRAALSTSGPREVFTRYADGFISASSATPTMPALRGLSL
jgi:hypothetical protein